MWQVSDEFLAALRGPHEIVTTVDVYDQGEAVLGDIPVVGGQLIRDRTALNYGRVSLEVASPDLAPLVPADQLGPAGFEVFVKRGIRFPNGTEELVPLGFFGIQDANVDGVSMTTSIEAVDRSQKISDARLETDRHIAPGTDSGLAALSLITDVMPDVTFDIDGVVTEVSGRLVWEAQSDRWQIVVDLFKVFGAEVRFNGIGAFVGRPEPDVRTDDPVWIVDEGSNGVLVSVDMAWSRRPSYNRAIITGTNTEFGVTYRGVATDSAPASPSYYSGRFGAKPIFLFSPHVTSNATALTAAKALLRSKQGVAMSLDFSAVPNPALEPGDVVTVKRGLLGLNMAVVVDSITLGLGPEDPMTCQVRARQEDDVT